MENEIRILIVEDEALIAQKIKMQLEDFGYTIAGICYNYQDAINAISNLTFDLLITDINLGEGINHNSGIQLAQVLKQKSNCPILFLTAFSDKDTIKKATQLTPAAYLVKPITAANLFASVQLAVDNFISSNLATLNTEQTSYFFVKLGNKYLKIFWKDVYHLESIKNYVKISSVEQKSAVLVSGSLQHVFQNMIPKDEVSRFIKINRAEAIAKNIILEITPEELVTKYGNFKISSSFNRKELGI